jgi:hypothetical protein
VSNTPAPTQPPPPTEDVCAKLSLGGFNAQAVRVKWTVNNSSGSSVTIGSMGINWPTYNQSLKRVEVGGSTVWSGEDDQPPTPISGVGSSIPAGSSKEIIFTFKKAVATTDYRLDVGFTNGCSVSQSN